MGTWGISVFSDDLAADIRDEFRELIGDGLTTEVAVERLLERYADAIDDPDERCVFWIALAISQWKLGRLEERTKHEALLAIESGDDLKRFDRPADRKKRAQILEKVRQDLLSPQPPVKRVRRTIKQANDWSIGEVIGLRLLSGRWTLLRTIGHHSDNGGTFAVCELLDWCEGELPPIERIRELPIRSRKEGAPQFLFSLPPNANGRTRLKRLGIVTPPAQSPGGYTAVVWKYVDDTLSRLFDIN